MAGPAPHFLATCHASILQRIIDRADASDLFLLRQVARRWRFAADGRIRRMRPTVPPTDLAARFPKLVSLDLSGCDPFSRLQLPKVISSPLTALRELSLIRFDTALPDEWMAQQLPGLTRLHLSYSNSTDDSRATLSMAARCRSLRRLQLVHVDLQWAPLQAAVSQLAGTLTDLNMGFIEIFGGMPPNGLRILNTGRLQALHIWPEFLDLPDLQAAFRDLAAFTSLQKLQLGGTGMTPAQLEQLNSLRQLTRLDLYDEQLSSAAVAVLTRLTQLSELQLEQRNLTDSEQEGAEIELIDLEAALAGFPRLTSLSLYIDNEVVGYECLSSLTGLTNLDGRCNLEVLEGTDVLPRLTGLQSLALCGWPHTIQLRQLSGLTRLTSLRLQFPMPYADETPTSCFDWLSALQALQELHLCLAWLGASALPALAALPALRRLSLQGTRLSPGCNLQPLEQLPALEWLNLPEAFEQPEQLPARLQVPFMKGRHWSIGRSMLDRVMGLVA